MARILRTTYDQGEVNDGETRLLAYLEKHLPDTYLVVPNLQLPHRNPRNGAVSVLEYDCVVVTPHAVYHLENKHWNGRLTGDDHDWQVNGRSKGNPFRGCEFKSKILASKLGEQDAAWRRAWVASAITLSHPSMVSMQLTGASADVAFTLDRGLSEFLQDPDRARSYAGKIEELQDAIGQFLAGYRSTDPRVPAPRQPRLFEAEYEIVDVLTQTDTRTDYVVKPRGVETKIFRKVSEYAVSLVHLNDHERRLRLGAIKNQYNALRQMATSPYILHVDFRSDDEQGFFYEITDYLEESSLRVALQQRTLTFQDRLMLLRNVAQGLNVAHAAGVYHRDVCPDNVFLSVDGSAFLANFGKSYFSDANRQGFTLFPTLREEELTAYMPPEMVNPHEADARTDVYGWGLTAYETLVGHLPRYPDGDPMTTWHDLDHFGGRLKSGQLPHAIQPELPDWTDELIDRCLRLNPDERWASMDEVLACIDSARLRGEPAPNQTAEGAGPYSHRDSEKLRQGDKLNEYLLIEQIGQGGYSEVWRVKHTLQSRDYAMKIFYPSVQFDSVLDEYEALKQIDHPNVVKLTWNGRLNNGRFFTLMELLEGDCLRDYVYGNPPLGMTLANVFRAGQELTRALTYLHGKGILHRDIKPHNIIWHRQERFVLIDFNVASIAENTERVGTDAYVSPDTVLNNRHANWDDSSDTFALGVTLYQLVCHAHPWRNQQPTLSTPPADPLQYMPQLSDAFASFLLKAVQPHRADRFTTAHEMQSALERLGLTGLMRPVQPNVEEPMQTSDFVDALNRLFSQSRYNNAGTRASTTRGLDPFARDTYIETRLDTHLKRAILEDRFRLIIITGNAGDGKTAFIQRLEDELRADSRAQFAPLPTGNGASFRIGTTAFQSNYDGSQDEVDQENSSVLDVFFRPFVHLTDFRQAPEGRLVAINEGRLVEYLEQRRAEFGYLADTIEAFFYNENATALPDGLLIINLNVRAVVSATNDTEPSLFRKQVKAFVNPIHWTGCADCAVRESCFIRFNAQSMNDSAAGDEVISRMEQLVRTVHFRRDLHITMRDLRSLLAFWITRDHRCADVRALVDRATTPAEWLSKQYYNLTAPQTDRANQDRLVEKLRKLDVGRSVVPALDRALFFSPLEGRNYVAFEEREGDLLATLNQWKDSLAASAGHPAVRDVQQLLARHQYFEGRFYQLYQQSDGDRQRAKDTADRLEENRRRHEGESVRNPYRSVGAFGQLVSPGSSEEATRQEREEARKSIAIAIARLENCSNNDLASRYVVQAAGRPDPLSASYRLFPLDDFELVEDRRPSLSEYMEYVPDKLIFRHRDPANRHIALAISLDLYEMLYHIQKGFSPSLNDLKGRFVEYQVFRNMLANLPYRKVVVTGDRNTSTGQAWSGEKYVAIEADSQNNLLIHTEQF